MKKKLLFCSVDLVLVLVLGLIFGVVLKDTTFAGETGLVGFIFLLASLLLPSVFILFGKTPNFAVLICSILLILSQCILNPIAIFKTGFDFKTYWIAQAAIFGAYLVSLLIIISLTLTKKE